MIADVVFDAPLPHPFSYQIPSAWRLAPGQRVVAPLRGAARVGMVVAVRAGEAAGLKPLARLAEPGPVLGREGLALADWMAAESLSSLGSTCAALLPPPAAGPLPAGAPPEVPRAGPADGTPGTVEVLTGAGRERRLLERVAAAPGAALVVAPDVETAARWAQRLARHGAVVRLDSGVADGERAAAWAALAAGAARLAVGTRSALLAPLGAGGLLALVDEHEAAHKPPGPPRLHSREVILERAAREGVHALLTSATPSVETWSRVREGAAAVALVEPGPWPAVVLADTRGILR
ncbi:MAG TPA: hypothetical protein VFX28_01350, partial [Methylomirabilota bacterium]|nr:hypothetical protein [Methylomirabilota bacterium]